jgi:hypothetical protein
MSAEELGSGSTLDRYRSALVAAQDQLRLPTADARLLRQHTGSTYLLRTEGIVLRLSNATNENRTRAHSAVRVTGWLTAQGFPVVEPLSEEPVEVDGVILTAWRYVPQPHERKPLPVLAGALGSLLHHLHDLPVPPFSLPKVDPMARLRQALAMDGERTGPVLADPDRAFLHGRMETAELAYRGWTSPSAGV